MEMNDLIARKNKMNYEILIAVNRAMSDFRKDSGLSPHSVTIMIFDITTIVDQAPDYVVGKVDSEVRI